ncbi:unnamed protein product [Angiostrongylus costaricensis]|uniref:THUMP domain-containing protein n=1 Tax=Angiostrongylus costaricensis TaxID=334426 RepID=A0A0R3PN35_ANGCS|nr:unnamed protein product [Angiostrongylus costaricensis]
MFWNLNICYSVLFTASNEAGKNSDDDLGEDVADSLKRICAEVREDRNRVRRCIQRPTGVKNCLFIAVQDADVVDLAERMVTYAQSSRQCRYLQRVLPVEETAEVDLKKLNDMILKCVSRHLKAREDGSVPSYSMEFRARNNDSVKKTDALEMLGTAVNSIAPTAKVDLNGADVTISVLLLRKTLMVGAAPNYFGKRKYIMRPKEEKFDAVEVDQKKINVENVLKEVTSLDK